MAVVASIARGHDASYPFKTIGAAEGPVLAFAEQHASRRRARGSLGAELLAAIADLRASPPPGWNCPEHQMRLKLRPGGSNGHGQDQPESHCAWSGWRRMRDSNSRGLAPNTLSKRAP